MPIEFPCPTCRQQVRTPDAAAGKKGKCPNCGTLVMIPAPAVAILPSQSPKPSPAPSPPATPSPPRSVQPPIATPLPSAPAQAATAGPIEFPCPNCQQTVRTPASAAGKKGKCPSCQSVVQIPGGSPAPKHAPPVPSLQPLAQPQTQPRPAASKPPPRQPDGIPTLTPLAPAPTANIPGLTPLGPAPQFGHAPANPFAGLTPLPAAPSYGAPGLTPLAPASATPGLVPLGPAPAAPIPGLVPLSRSLPTLTPVSADPLAGLPAVSPLGIPPSQMGAPLHPYSSPIGTSYSQPAYQRPQISDHNRRGLTWEREQSMDAFGDTVNDVLGSPAEAFERMRRTGGIGNPLGFFIIGSVIGQIAAGIYSTIMQAIILAANGGVFPWEALLIYGAMMIVGGIVGVVIAGTIGMFISAAIAHLCLMMVGGANAGYEATFRVLCFGAGSVAVLNAIPIVGPIIGIFMTFVVLIHGYARAHETSGGQAAAAVFLPMLFICCICCGFGSLSGFGSLLAFVQSFF